MEAGFPSTRASVSGATRPSGRTSRPLTVQNELAPPKAVSNVTTSVVFEPGLMKPLYDTYWNVWLAVLKVAIDGLSLVPSGLPSVPTYTFVLSRPA